MVRTRAENSARKAIAAKAPRKQLGTASSAGCSSKTPSKKGAYSSGGGGNPLRVCDIPTWQKGIGEFYPKLKKENQTGKDEERSDQNGGKCHELASSSDCQPGSSCSSSDVGVEMQCEADEGRADAEESKQGQASHEESIEEETMDAPATKENIPEQARPKDGSCDDEAVAGSSSMNDDEKPVSSR